MTHYTPEDKGSGKAQISLEFLIVTSLVLFTFIVMGYIIYQKYVEYADLSLNLKGKEIAKKFSENINQMVIVGDGYTKYISAQTRYPGDEFNITLSRGRPEIFVENKWNWFYPLLTTNVYCCLPECKTLCEETVFSLNESGRIKAENLNGRIYIGGACSQDRALVSEWEFDEGEGNITYDSFGASNGLINGSAAWTEGNCSTGLGLDRSDDYVLVENSKPLEDITETNFTWMVWYNTSNLVAWETDALICKTNGTNSTSMFWMSGNRFGLGINTSTGSYLATSKPYASLLWHQVAGVLNDSDKTLRIYVNGIEDGSTVYTGELLDYGLVPLTIGACGNSSSANYMSGGVIDNIKVFNRALTPDEILREYENSI